MIYCLKKNSASISRVLYPRGVSIINLELRIATCFSCFLPSSLREQRSCTGILGIAAHRMLVSLPLCRLLVSFAGTKHCCLTAVNRDGALCCPDFPRDRGLKPYAFLPLSRDRPIHYFCALCSGCVASRDCLPSLMGAPKIFNFWGERRHKSLNAASGSHCDLVAEREERHTGIEPASSAWEADALPMC